jgi:PAS domain S-box-containing protein
VAAKIGFLATVAAATLVARRLRRRRGQGPHAGHGIAMLRAIPDLLLLHTREGVYLDYHARTPEQLLLAPERFIGRHMHEVLPADIVRQMQPMFERVWTSEEPIVGEFSLNVRDQVRHYEVRLVRCGTNQVMGVVRDISERRRTADALSASEERYALATAAGRVGVWDWHLETGDLYVDSRLKRLLGFTEGEIANRFETWSKLAHPDDVEQVLACANRHIAGDTAVFEIEFRMVAKDGSIRWIATRGALVRNGGDSARMVGTYTDVTGAKQTSAAAHHGLPHLDRTSRLAAFGEFTASIAHELKQPLTAIGTNAAAGLKMLGKPSPDLQELRAALTDIVDDTKRADQIIRSSRNLFRRHVVEKRAVNVNDIVRDVTMLVMPRLRAHDVRLVINLAETLPPVLGDRLELSQVVLNLTTNAIDAMQPVQAARVLELSTRPARTTVQVSIRDGGVGFDDVDVDRLFTTGYTTKSDGTGVGLSICRTIIEAHGGKIWAAPNAGGGATFTFELPIDGAPSEALTSSSASRPAAPA